MRSVTADGKETGREKEKKNDSDHDDDGAEEKKIIVIKIRMRSPCQRCTGLGTSPPRPVQQLF